MPAPLSSTASPLELVPGDDRALEELAARLRTFAAGAAEAAGQLRDIQAGSWVGEAADAFREQIGDLPRRLDGGADAFYAAQRALDAHADALREARRVAARAIDDWAEGERATARWEAEVREHRRAEQSAAMTAALSGLPATPVGAGPSGVDPGADDRARATRLLEGARESVDDSARAAAHVLREAAEAAPDEPSWLRRAAGQVGEFFAGAGEATWGMAVFAWKVSPTYALVDPEGFVEHGRGLVEGLVYGVQHPVEFGKAVLDWETWQENPARALGHLVPDLVLALATAGAGTAATGGRRAADAVDEAADLAAAARRADEAAGLGTQVRRAQPGDGTRRTLDEQLADPRVHPDNAALVDPDWDPLAGLSPQQYRERWRNAADDDWDWPPDAGAVPGSQRWDELDAISPDRIGGPAGSYFGEAGDPFTARSLPPDRLNFPRSDFDVDLDRARDAGIRVQSSGVAPWFGQPGGGTQYQFFVDGSEVPLSQAQLEQLEVLRRVTR